MAEDEPKKEMYWLDKFEGKAKGGIFYRAFDLIKFMKLVEEKQGKVVAIVFEKDSNNIELIHEDLGKEDETTERKLSLSWKS